MVYCPSRKDYPLKGNAALGEEINLSSAERFNRRSNMQGWYYKWGKRLFDIIIVLIAMVLLSPLIALIALAVLLSMGTPVIYKQARAGLHGKPFIMYKFRTMTDGRDQKGQLLPDEQRLTRLGRFLRCTSLDELPELWNVFKGEMSLVGPRPLLIEYLPYYTKEQMRRHDVKPGITGWAQINGRNAISWEKKFKYDVWYVDNFNFWLDLKILFKTVIKVLKREGINDKNTNLSPIKFDEWVKQKNRYSNHRP